MSITNLSFKGDKLSTDKLRKIWKIFKPRKKFPNVVAYVVIKEDFLKIHKKLQEDLVKNVNNPYIGEEFEYGIVDHNSNNVSAFLQKIKTNNQ